MYGARVERRRAGPATGRDNVGKGAGGNPEGGLKAPGKGGAGTPGRGESLPCGARVKAFPHVGGGP